MEQTPSSPGRSPELPTVSLPSNGETLGAEQRPEVANEGAVERQETRGGSAPVDNGAPAAAIPTPITAPPQPVSTAGDTAQTSVILPTVANDDDLIEKEWVDKAKKVLAETRDDPYLREQEVNRLQADYLLKRYGRELGSAQ